MTIPYYLARSGTDAVNTRLHAPQVEALYPHLYFTTTTASHDTNINANKCREPRERNMETICASKSAVAASSTSSSIPPPRYLPSPGLMLMVLWAHRIALHPRPSRSSDGRERPPTESQLGTSVLILYPNFANLPSDGMETKRETKKQTKAASQNGHFRTPGLAHGRCLFLSTFLSITFHFPAVQLLLGRQAAAWGGPIHWPGSRSPVSEIPSTITIWHQIVSFPSLWKSFSFFSLHCLLGVLEVLGFLLISGPVPCRPVGLGVYYRDGSTPAFSSTLPACPASPVMTLGISS
ncbi:uncharacterized protein BDZ83DRAFT_378546 [Colletotrichum acutatum]|uniref:Uncharacterized protein n=1 Tax=Glomerella acutata TaxID=27357 RepID=A0AAD9D2A7_GLOAC|nr:uncharacterized protein BDZ83DRAFT_378546 [Colletotrichum acutatum]KAK1730659.1 hypothetical protein BDZ83DRAFT_378546 [Colletotrichum acutatum]